MKQDDIDPHKAIDYIFKTGMLYAKAKAELTYMEEYRKSLKALLMQEAMTTGSKSVAAAEVYAYSADRYIAHLRAIQQAVEVAEGHRWGLVSAQARIDVFRSIEASNRTMDRAAQ